MEFNFFLNSHLFDPARGARRLYADMVEQGVTADRTGFRAVSIPEHHLISILMVPSPLQMAVKLAGVTKRVQLVTAVAVLPIRDMRIFAGEVVQCDMLCDHRLVLGVGRGAFAWELARLDTPIEGTRRKFGESLQVLEALLDGEDVAWDGEFYKFDPITIMPRPERRVPIQVAAVTTEAIFDTARRGTHVQTAPLKSSHEVLLQQVDAFRRGKAAAGEKGRDLMLSLQRGIYLARDEADAREKIRLAHHYYRRFDNVFTGPGIVKKGIVEALPENSTVEEIGRNLIICPRAEMIDRLGQYAEAGIDEVIMSSNFGQSQADTLDMIERFAAEVMPHFTGIPQAA